jgi:hypothetical protein
MDHARIARLEHLALQSPLSLQQVCAAIGAALRLPAMHFDCENETEWGLCEMDGIEYSVSRPYRSQTLREWDATVPPGCNVGISLMISKQHPRADDGAWINESLVPSVCARIAEALGCVVHHHRSGVPGRVLAPATGGA